MTTPLVDRINFIQDRNVTGASYVTAGFGPRVVCIRDGGACCLCVRDGQPRARMHAMLGCAAPSAAGVLRRALERLWSAPDSVHSGLRFLQGAYTPAAVAGRGGGPPKKRRTESPPSPQLCQERSGGDSTPYRTVNRSLREGFQPCPCSAESTHAHDDDIHRPKRARRAPARFDMTSFAPDSGTQDNAKPCSPTAHTRRSSRRSQHRRRCPASVPASSGRRTAPTQAGCRRAKSRSS